MFGLFEGFDVLKALKMVTQPVTARVAGIFAYGLAKRTTDSSTDDLVKHVNAADQ